MDKDKGIENTQSDKLRRLGNVPNHGDLALSLPHSVAL